jgi:proteasome activator subunit 4
VNKTLTLFGTVVDCHQRRISDIADKYVDILFDNANTGYAEVRKRFSLTFGLLVNVPLS